MLLLAPAFAETRCDSVDAFNSYMLDHDSTPSVTVEFDVTGVNPADFAGSKGALVELTTTRCDAGASNVVKVYGPEDPPNEAHPTGTLKQEYGYGCCSSGDCGETWSDPNASEQVFFDGSESCVVFAWIDPESFGYHLECSTGVFDAYGVNDYDMPVDLVSLFYLESADTWEIPAAVSTWNEVCWEVSEDLPDDTGEPDPGGEDEWAVLQDATAWQASPDEVYPDATDLSVEAGDSVAYLQFDLSDLPGRITGATLSLRTGDDGSSEGSGADVWLADGSAWSEGSLTWNSRPGLTAKLASGGAIGAATDSSWALAGLEPGLITLALVAPDGADNGTHFRSKEAGEGPSLRVTWVDDGGGGGDSGDGAVDSGDDGGGGDGDGDGDDSGGPSLDGDRDGKPPGDTGLPAGCGCDQGSAFAGLGALLAALALRRR